MAGLGVLATLILEGWQAHRPKRDDIENPTRLIPDHVSLFRGWFQIRITGAQV